MPPIRDQALVLRHWEYSETSQTVSLFTRGHGLIRGLAKGCRRDRSTFSGGFEALTIGEIGASLRPNSELATLTDWDMQEVVWGTRRSLLAHLAGLYIIDLLHHALRPLDPHPVLFDRAAASLRALEHERSIPATVLRFQWALLVEMGLQPRLDHLGVSASATIAPAPPPPHDGSAAGQPRALRRAHHFSPAQGGLVNPSERHDGGDSSRRSGQSSDIWKVRPETLDLLRAIGRDQPPSSAERNVVIRASRLLGSYLQVILERDFPTHEAYFARVGPPVQSS